MSEPWADIVAKFNRKQSLWDGPFSLAFAGVEQVAVFIANGPLNSALFGWTAMHDLCIQQTNVQPYTGPFLRISPLVSGEIEFRHVNTAIASRQWSRVVPVDDAVNRLNAFLGQIRWTVLENSSACVADAEPLAADLRVSEHAIHVVLQDGREISAPLAWYPRLRDADAKARGQWRLIGLGEGIHWPQIDEDISVLGLLAGR